ncbi:MAG: TRAP transporter large permease subunit [Myxococcota bacterium]
MSAMALALFAVACGVLLLGYPVALSLGGTALAMAFLGTLTGTFDVSLLSALPSRLYGVMTNPTLLAVPLFVYMGTVLERSRVAEALLETMGELLQGLRGGLGLSVTLVGLLMAASTGIVGATVVTMGVISLPTMLRHGYRAPLAAGVICATGTLGQIVPPSISLVLLGDVLSSAFQQAQLEMGVFSPKTVSVGDLFAGALVPGLILVSAYALFVLGVAVLRPDWVPSPREDDAPAPGRPGLGRRALTALVPPVVLIAAVLGSILTGVATPTEAAAVGATGAVVLGFTIGDLTLHGVFEAASKTVRVTSMVFMILIGAAAFSLVFRGFGGDELIRWGFERSQLGPNGMLLVTMVAVFLLGFLLDFIEITFVVVPIVGPILLKAGFDPTWLGVLLAVNLQTSFLTPPFGFSLFYLRGVAPESVSTRDIYRGVIPFVAIQVATLFVLFAFPSLATGLPELLYGRTP